MLVPSQLIQRLRSRLHIVDGGFATELEKRGHDISGRLWSGHVLLTDPEAIEDLHFDYLMAGADIVITSTYQLSLQGMADMGYTEDQGHRALIRSVECGLKARQRWLNSATERQRTELPLIAASIGPYGASRADGSEYTGDYDLDYAGLYQFHYERARLLVETNCDLLAFETVPSLTEAEVLGDLIREMENPPAWISFCCRDGDHISDGTHISKAAQRVLERCPDLVAIGVNCTSPQYVESLLGYIADIGDPLVITYPNSGETWNAAGRCWEGESDPDDYTDYAKKWIDAGAGLIGGCCRTGPAHIRALKQKFVAKPTLYRTLLVTDPHEST